MKRSLRFPKEVGTYEVPNFIYFQPSKINFGEFNSDFYGEYGNSFQAKKLSSGSSTIAGRTTYNHVKKAQSLSVGGIIDSIANGVKESLGSLLDGNIHIGGKVDLFGGKVTAKLDIGNLGINTEGVQETSTVENKPGITLYMPPEIAHKTSAKYNVGDVKAYGAAFLEGQENVSSLVKGGDGRTASQFAGDITSSILNFGAGVAVDKLSQNSTVTNIFQRATGRVVNSYSFAMFGGMEHRRFNYSFKLVARSETDTKTIKDICDSFMQYMLPTRSTNSDFHMYDIPYRWDIGYYNLDEKNSFMDQPFECFLESVDIKYSGEGLGSTYNNGAPLIVDLSLNFVEIEPLFIIEQRKDKYGKEIADIALNNDPTSGYAG